MQDPADRTAQVELALVGATLDPDEVTKLVEFLPSRAWMKGQSYRSRSGQELTKPWGLWATTCWANDVSCAATELLNRVEPKITALQEAARRAKAEMVVAIWWDPPGGQGGFDLESNVMRRLSSLSDRFSFYLPGSREG